MFFLNLKKRTLIHIYQNETNITIFKLTIRSSVQKVIIEHYCINLKKSCNFEIDTSILFNSKNNTPNFLAIKVSIYLLMIKEF